ncbi:hypothetical protein HHI36_016842 [Cryptolaemus montrouzieri]|uniref:CCHC-type domain-containing protein n=1 Tax=Cryptolaemus montrouzieri TaxID=559131 RepID=A0ABD2NLX2_9CUCU
MSDAIIRLSRKPTPISETLYIRGLDGDITKEIQEKLNQTAEDLGANRDVVVENLRRSYGKTQVATVCSSGKTASVLEKAVELRTRVGECHLHRKTDVPICFKHKECGHIDAECKGEKHTACFKCGQGGHKGRDCQRERYCSTCKVPGHS